MQSSENAAQSNISEWLRTADHLAALDGRLVRLVKATMGSPVIRIQHPTSQVERTLTKAEFNQTFLEHYGAKLAEEDRPRLYHRLVLTRLDDPNLETWSFIELGRPVNLVVQPVPGDMGHTAGFSLYVQSNLGENNG